jgi:hypothetical protein
MSWESIIKRTRQSERVNILPVVGTCHVLLPKAYETFSFGGAMRNMYGKYISTPEDVNVLRMVDNVKMKRNALYDSVFPRRC